MQKTVSGSENNSTRCRFWIAALAMGLTLTCHLANSTRCRYWIASLAMAFGLTSHVSAANESLKVNNGPEKSDRTALIDITIETSRSQPTAGDGLGVSGDIKNVSDSVIHIEGKEIDLVLPPELEGPGKPSLGTWALLPTEFGPANDPWKTGIDLSPGDSYKVFWTQGVKYSVDQDHQSYIKKIFDVIAAEMTFIFFPPGDYKIAVVCKYQPVVDSKPGPYRTIAQTAIIHVAAPQFVILFGAAIGGLLAYFILPQARARLVKQAAVANDTWYSRFAKRAVKELAGIAGALLLSAMITILLSRISETQFLIKVTITDVWGAIAIGFIANYFGAKALDKILHGFSGDRGGKESDARAHKSREEAASSR